MLSVKANVSLNVQDLLSLGQVLSNAEYSRLYMTMVERGATLEHYDHNRRIIVKLNNLVLYRETDSDLRWVRLYA